MSTEEEHPRLTESFDDLVDRHAPRLFALAYLILDDQAAAEDAVQETLIKAWRSMAQLRSPDRLEGWLRQILINSSRDQLRQLRRRQRVIGALSPQEKEPDTNDPLADVDEIARAMQHLSHEHREVIVLRYYADLSAKAIGEALKVPEGTVRSRLHHGLRALRGRLESESRGGV